MIKSVKIVFKTVLLKKVNIIFQLKALVSESGTDHHVYYVDSWTSKSTVDSGCAQCTFGFNF